MSGRPVLLLLCCSLPGCWSQQAALEIDRPPLEPIPDRDPSQAPASRPAATPPRLSGADRGEGGSGRETTITLPNGLLIVVRADTTTLPALARTATLRLVLPAGRRHARTGQIDLAAGMLLWSAEQGLPSLELAVQQLGGTVDCWIGARDTALEMVVPSDRLAVALERLVAALQREPRSEEQLEPVRVHVLREWRKRHAAAPLETLLHRLLASPATTPAEYLARTQEATLDDVRTAWLALARPSGATLAISTSGPTPDSVAVDAKSAFAAWSGGSVSSAAVANRPEREALGDIVWAQRPGMPTAALVLRLPELGDKLDVETLVLQQCLTQDGIGGRLGHALERMLGPSMLAGRIVRDGGRRYVMLETTAAPEQVLMLYGALRLALESLARERPDQDELAVPTARARLLLLEDDADAGRWAAGAGARTTERRPDGALQRAIARLQQPDALSVAEAVPELEKSVVALLVLGGTPPAGAKVTRLEQVDPPERVASTVGADEGEREKEARPYLDLAVEKLGGAALLGSASGYIATCEVRTSGAATALDTIVFRDDGKLRRVRRVLATTLEAIVAGGAGTESSGDQRVELTSDEATSLLQRAERHPIALLAGWLRGRLRFKLVSLREINGREMAILELIDPTRERLRLQIDAQSGLVRLIETREHWPGVGRVQVVEELSDYQSHRGLRTPFRTTTTIDAATEPIVIDWKQFSGRPPSDQHLERGGPVDPDEVK